MSVDAKTKVESKIDVKKEVESYKESVRNEAEELIKGLFPKMVLELNNLLGSEKFQLSRVGKIPTDINIPQPEAEVNNCDAPGKKRKLDQMDGEILGTKMYILPHGAAPCNSNIKELMDIIKPHIINLIEHSNKIKMWVTLTVPKIEDGNNFGVSVQEDTLAEARQVEQESAAYLDQISRYFTTRAKVASKVAKYPHLDDYRQALVEIDEKQFISLRLMVVELRNQYVSLHDYINKNLEKIKRPRTTNSDNLY